MPAAAGLAAHSAHGHFFVAPTGCVGVDQSVAQVAGQHIDSIWPLEQAGAALASAGVLCLQRSLRFGLLEEVLFEDLIGA